MSEHEILSQIRAPHFTAGGIMCWQNVRGEIPAVAAAAPIIRYMIGWTSRRLKNYCDRKGWTVAKP